MVPVDMPGLTPSFLSVSRVLQSMIVLLEMASSWRAFTEIISLFWNSSAVTLPILSTLMERITRVVDTETYFVPAPRVQMEKLLANMNTEVPPFHRPKSMMLPVLQTNRTTSNVILTMVTSTLQTTKIHLTKTHKLWSIAWIISEKISALKSSDCSWNSNYTVCNKLFL